MKNIHLKHLKILKARVEGSSFFRLSTFSKYVLTIFIIGITAVLCYPLSKETGHQVISLVFLFVVSVLATFMKLGPVLLASTLSALVWNFFFIPPSFTFHIKEPADVLMFGMFFIIALVNGVLTTRIRKQEILARMKEERANALFELSKELSLINSLNELVSVAVVSIKKNFSFNAFFILSNENRSLNYSQLFGQQRQFQNIDKALTNWTFNNMSKAGNFTKNYSDCELTCYPLIGNRINPGIVIINQNKPFSTEEEMFWITFLAQISNSIEKEFLNELARKAKFLDESDRLYKTLFNSISHELRIPVASIMGASDSLMSSNHSEEINQELYKTIFFASVRLNRLIENLLNMSRLESGRISARPDWCDLNDLFNKVIENLKEEAKSHILVSEVPADMPLVKLDFGLMEQVLYNLILNSCQYSPPASNIIINAYLENGKLIISIMDRGPGFPEEAIPLIFNKFYRVEGNKTGGIGLGLSIVKGFIEAHNGTISVGNLKNGGAKFCLALPVEIADINQFPKLEQ